MGLFEELKDEGEAAIDRWIKERRGEDIYFDCKLKADPAKYKLDREDRRNIGKSLTAFANSDGGLLLWGVDAREIDGVDRLTDKKPIAQLAAFRSNVEHAIAELISPPIPGLDFHEISSPTSEGSGYLAISVPCSERRPHMSKNNSEQGFYFRNGHRSLLMEVFQVRDQMLRRSVPKLEFEWDIRLFPNEPARANSAQAMVPYSLDLILVNNSAASARFPYLIMQFDRGRYVAYSTSTPRYGQLLNGEFPLLNMGPLHMRKIAVNSRYDSQDWEFAGGADCCIHPGTKMQIASIKLVTSARVSSFLTPGDDHQQWEPNYHDFPVLFLAISYGCLDAPCERLSIELTSDNLHKKLFENGRCGTLIVR